MSRAIQPTPIGRELSFRLIRYAQPTETCISLPMPLYSRSHPLSWSQHQLVKVHCARCHTPHTHTRRHIDPQRTGAAAICLAVQTPLDVSPQNLSRSHSLADSDFQRPCRLNSLSGTPAFAAAVAPRRLCIPNALGS